MKLVQRLVALRAHRAPPAVRAPVKAAWWSLLSVAVQQAVGHTALGRARALPGPAHADAPALDEVLHLADPDGPSRDRAFGRVKRKNEYIYIYIYVFKFIFIFMARAAV